MFEIAVFLLWANATVSSNGCFYLLFPLNQGWINAGFYKGILAAVT